MNPRKARLIISIAALALILVVIIALLGFTSEYSGVATLLPTAGLSAFVGEDCTWQGGYAFATASGVQIVDEDDATWSVDAMSGVQIVDEDDATWSVDAMVLGGSL